MKYLQRLLVIFAVVATSSSGALFSAESAKVAEKWLGLFSATIKNSSNGETTLGALIGTNATARRGVRLARLAIQKNPGGSSAITEHPERFIRQIDAAIKDADGDATKVIQYFENIEKIRIAMNLSVRSFGKQLEVVVRPLRYSPSTQNGRKGFRGSIGEVSQAAKDGSNVVGLGHLYPDGGRQGRDFVTKINGINVPVEVRSFAGTGKSTSVKKATDTGASHIKRLHNDLDFDKIETSIDGIYIDIRWQLGPGVTLDNIKDGVRVGMMKTIKWSDNPDELAKQQKKFKEMFANQVTFSAFE